MFGGILRTPTQRPPLVALGESERVDPAESSTELGAPPRRRTRIYELGSGCAEHPDLSGLPATFGSAAA